MAGGLRSGGGVHHGAVRGCSSAMVDQPSPGTSTWIISGVAATASGIHAMAAWKCAECTCASPAARSLKASSSTNWLGLSTLRDHSKKTLPGSARVAAVKGATRASHWSATSGRTANFTSIYNNGPPPRPDGTVHGDAASVKSMVGRGVLLDVAKYKGTDPLPSGYWISLVRLSQNSRLHMFNGAK